MRYQYVVVIAIVATGISLGCGVKPNPNVCCETEAQCEKVGAHELRPCEVGQACSDGTCVASQCNVSSDCPAENPICMDNLCIGSCATDDQCAGTDRPFCDAGVCVGCRSPLDCSGDTAICDQEEHECRGCVADDECASGVCIEFEATCAMPDQILYVKQFGADTGTCTASAPCATLNYAAQQVTATRNVIRVLGGGGASATVTTSMPVVFDGSGTTLSRLVDGPLFRVTSATTTIEGFSINSTVPDMETIAVTGGTLRMTNTSLNRALVTATNGGLELEAVKVSGPSLGASLLRCQNGAASISRSEFHDAWLDSSNCLFSFQRNRVDGGDQLINVQGGKITVENNLFVQQKELGDSTGFGATLTGSVIRFNTFVNVSGVISDGVAIACDGTQEVSNNIFAYQSMHPLNGYGVSFTCPVTHSLFDGAALPEQREGEGNIVSEFALIFSNVSAKDFHLAATSPAKGVGQANLSNVDFDGNPRPLPAGTNPDVGCYEGP
jgi:hypothetical protein